MIAKCGEIKVWHWAHKDGSGCASWKPETKWHRTWKERFPDPWQEVGQEAADGERQIADVKTAHGWVLEFQHSSIKPEERRSREEFYGRLIWLVDAKQHQKLRDRFLRAYEKGTSLSPDGPVGRVASEGARLRTWVLSNAHVFFDFGDDQLWWLAPASDSLWAYVQPFSLATFVEVHQLTRSDDAPEFERIADSFSRKVAYWTGPNRPSLVARRR